MFSMHVCVGVLHVVERKYGIDSDIVPFCALHSAYRVFTIVSSMLIRYCAMLNICIKQQPAMMITIVVAITSIVSIVKSSYLVYVIY